MLFHNPFVNQLLQKVTGWDLFGVNTRFIQDASYEIKLANPNQASEKASAYLIILDLFCTGAPSGMLQFWGYGT